MTVAYNDVVFAFDFARIETIGGVRYLWDYGPHGLHAVFPGGASDPLPQLDGSFLFQSAGPDQLTLPLRYYTVAPTGSYSWLVVYRAAISGSTDMIFSTYVLNAGNYYGTALIGRPTIPEMRIYSSQGTAVAMYERITSLPSESDKKIVAVTIETTPRSLKNEQIIGPPVWAAGAFGTVVYDATQTPRIGRDPGLWNGDIYIWYLAQIRGAISSPDMASLSALIANGVKPWCVRR